MRFFTRFAKIISIILVAVLLLLAVEPIAASFFSPPPPLFFAREAHAGVADYLFDVFKQLLNTFFGFPIRQIIEFLGGDLEALYRIITWLEYFISGFVPLDMMILITIIFVTEQDRLFFWINAQQVELPAILAGGVIMIITGLIATALAKVLKRWAYWVEAGVLAAIVGFDGAVAATAKSLRSSQKEWYEQIMSDYENDRRSLPGGVFHDLAPKYSGIRTDLSGAGGISYVQANALSAKFDEVNPGYRKTSDSLYIDDYKKIAENWRQYMEAQNRTAQTEQNDFAALSETITALAKASLEDGVHYTRSIEARAQVYAFGAQQTTNLRSDIARQIDMRAREALDREQREADLHAAFGRATKGGAAWPKGTGY